MTTNQPAYVNRSIHYSFGPGQAEGIDNVTVHVTTATTNPFTGTETKAVESVTVQLPTSGWGEAEVLTALQTKLPQFDVQWEPAPEVAPEPEAPVAPEETPAP